LVSNEERAGKRSILAEGLVDRTAGSRSDPREQIRRRRRLRTSEWTRRRRRCGCDDGRAGKHQRETDTIKPVRCNRRRDTRACADYRQPRDAGESDKKSG
jgi:hypothetical protein